MGGSLITNNQSSFINNQLQGFFLYSMAIIDNNARQMPGRDLAEQVKVLQKLTRKICEMKIDNFA